MHRLLTAGIRRPRAVLAAWLAVTALLGIIGTGVAGHLSAGSLSVAGSASAREAKLFEQHFGKSTQVPILLQGPRAQLDSQGPLLVARLQRLPGAHVVSAWDSRALGKALRPSGDTALVLLAVTVRAHTSLHTSQLTVTRAIKNSISAPVTAKVTGVDAIGAQLEDASLSAVHTAELIAIPVLLVVLLVVFGSPAAAALPAVLGLGTVFSGFGLIALLAELMPLTDLATSAASMMGLALGVDYTLLVVSRFRDELTTGAGVDEIERAATVAALRAGRTVAFAGGAISLLMLSALVVSAGTLLISAVVGVIVVAMISVLATLLAAPAALVLCGRHVGRGGARLHRDTAATTTREPMAVRLSSSGLLVGLAAAATVALASQAMSLTTGPPDARQLPSGSPARAAYESLSKKVGAGWGAPFQLTAVAPNGVITTVPRLDAIAAAQRAIRKDPDVATVIGPGALARRARPLLHAAASIAATNSRLARSARDVNGLSTSLGQAAAGAQRVQSGFARAAAAVSTLAGGGSDSGGAVTALRAGLAQAIAGSRLTQQGLNRADHAASRVANGGDTAAASAARLANALSSGSALAASAQPRLSALADKLSGAAATARGLADPVSALSTSVATANSQVQNAGNALAAMRIGHLDPRYRAASNALAAAQAALANIRQTGSLADQLRSLGDTTQQASDDASTLAGAVGSLAHAAAQLQVGATTLRAGIAQLAQGQRALSAGIRRLAVSGSALTNGLVTLSGGTATLGAHLAALQSGARRLAGDLASQQQQTGMLGSALAAGQRNASSDGRTLPANSSILSTLAHTPNAFRSGYLVLAGLEGANPVQRAGLDFTINVGQDGQAARMLIVARSAPGSKASAALRRRLDTIATTLSATGAMQATVGGPAAQLADYAASASGRIPLLILTLMVVTFAMLVVVFRSLLAPLVGVVLNLLTVSAAFGVLSILAGGSHPLVGGPGYVDALGISAMFTAVFALSIDYQVFLLMRMREGWLRTGDVARGVDYGVARTARVVAGAAGIMAGVFLAFTSAEVATIRQLGIGLAAAVIIDATIVRLVLLPAALRLGGRHTWWLPAWLDRRLPVLDIGAERRRRDRDPNRELAELEALANAEPAPEPHAVAVA